MADSIQAAAQWLERTAIGVMVRESLWGFPIVVGIHILGLMFSVGFLLWFDLRLVGIGLTGARVSAVYRRLIPWAGVGFVTMFATGGMLFTAFASAAMGNGFFGLKIAALALAAA